MSAILMCKPKGSIVLIHFDYWSLHVHISIQMECDIYDALTMLYNVFMVRGDFSEVLL